MTDPVILLGTQSNGETLPVQVNSFGQLVAEGLQGSEGPEGPQGPQGPQGPEGPEGPGGIELPPDPYEGALLGWLDGGLAWVGAPPVPVPEGVFGPITGWDAQSGYLSVDGDVPSEIDNGVYIWQCDEQGVYFTEGWVTSQVWSDDLTCDKPPNPGKEFKYAFDGNITTTFSNESVGGGTWTFIVRQPGNYKVNCSTNGGRTITVDGSIVATVPVGGDGSNVWYPLGYVGEGQSISIFGEAGGLLLYGWMVDNKMLVDPEFSLNMRVNQRFGDGVIGVPNQTIDFTIGKYLRVPEQRVAPWVLYGNDPTSLIDHLRSS